MEDYQTMDDRSTDNDNSSKEKERMIIVILIIIIILLLLFLGLFYRGEKQKYDDALAKLKVCKERLNLYEGSESESSRNSWLKDLNLKDFHGDIFVIECGCNAGVCRNSNQEVIDGNFVPSPKEPISDHPGHSEKPSTKGNTPSTKGNTNHQGETKDQKLEIEVKDKVVTWDDTKKVNIFGNKKIAPGSTGNYNFKVINKGKLPIKYQIIFSEKNTTDFDMVYKLNKNGSPVLSNYLKANVAGIKDNHLAAFGVDDYTLDWKWQHGPNDTNTGKNVESYTLYVTIKAVNE